LRKPLLELKFPVRNDGLRTNNKMFSLDVLEFPQESNERNSLDSFTEALHIK
jgi:hypothetical protein